MLWASLGILGLSRMSLNPPTAAAPLSCRGGAARLPRCRGPARTPPEAGVSQDGRVLLDTQGCYPLLGPCSQPAGASCQCSHADGIVHRAGTWRTEVGLGQLERRG